MAILFYNIFIINNAADTYFIGPDLQKENNMFNYLKNKVSGLFKERTTWDGAVLIGAGVVFLMFTPFRKPTLIN